MPIYYKLKKLTAAVLALVFFVSFAGFFAPSADAVTPTYNVSAEYKASKYYKDLKDYKLTGDERFDVISIAFTQYGYHEGNSDADMGGGNLDGHKNFAEYNRMYGKLDNGEGNGLSYGYSWCAAFVSWCMRQARVSTSTVETFVSCSKAVKSFRSKGQFKEASSGYIPQAGDIIFFVSPEDAARGYIASHVGLVVGTDNGYIYTIEGNTDNYMVCQKSYAFDSEKLVGFAVPKYKTVEGTVYDFPQKTDMKFPGNYTVTKEKLAVCRESEKYNTALGYLKAGDKVEVKEVVLGWGLIDFGGKEGWIYLFHAEREQSTLTLDANGGFPSLSYHNKDMGVPLELSPFMPSREGYTLLGWSSSKGGVIEYWADSVYLTDADVTLYAVWRVEEYTVEFLDYDGRSISSRKYPYGNAIVVPEDPVRPADGKFTYEFVSWGKTVSEVATADEVYHAIYKAVPMPETTEPPVTTAPETTAEPEVTTEPPAPETTAEPEVTTSLPEETTLPETTKTPEVTEPITTAPEVTLDPTLGEVDDSQLFGCASVMSMPLVMVFVALGAMGLVKREG